MIIPQPGPGTKELAQQDVQYSKVTLTYSVNIWGWGCACHNDGKQSSITTISHLSLGAQSIRYPLLWPPKSLLWSLCPMESRRLHGSIATNTCYVHSAPWSHKNSTALAHSLATITLPHEVMMTSLHWSIANIRISWVNQSYRRWQPICIRPATKSNSWS